MTKILATPKAKAMAKAANIDLADIKISGSKIDSSDVENYLKSLKTASSSTPKAPQNPEKPAQITPKTFQLEGRRETIAPIRKAIAKAMTNS